MPPPSIVLDTNVLLSANINPHGLEQLVYSHVVQQSLRLFVSETILVEYKSVLSGPKFRFPPAEIAESLALLLQNSILVAPATTLAISPDERDNRFLECAECAGADFLVTGNRRHFPSIWKSTRIVGARELLEAAFNLHIPKGE
jgi:putative PIN family toxin of toxin-antitoxin system